MEVLLADLIRADVSNSRLLDYVESDHGKWREVRNNYTCDQRNGVDTSLVEYLYLSQIME
jgi:hypothetical protein